MPYFVRIGAVEQNISGVGARGYHLFRRGRTIISRWGPVKVLPGRRFHWIYRREKRYTLRSEAAARAVFRQQVAKRADTYSQLPRGASIRGSG